MSVMEAPVSLAMKWMEVGRLSDIPLRGSLRVTVDGNAIAIFRTAQDEVFAIDDKCPHANGPLSQGIVHGDCVTCPLHNWVICLRDGQAQGADEGATRSYAVRINGQCILIGLNGDAF